MPGLPITASKGVATVKYPAQVIFTVFTDISLRSKWQ